jgi:putative ABC transport system ATP-binding protein
MPIIRTENLTKDYGTSGVSVRAVNQVSLSINKGEFCAIVGMSGSGKSSLLHLLGGIEEPTSGKVFFEDKDIFSLDESELAVLRRRNVGIIFQFFNLLPLLTVEENILLPQLLDSRIPNQERVDKILELTGLSDRRASYPRELSGGQQQRVSVARALVNDPLLLLADEPTGNLDSKTGRSIMELLKVANKKYGQTLVVVTHDENIALQANRIITIKDGRISSDERIR